MLYNENVRKERATISSLLLFGIISSPTLLDVAAKAVSVIYSEEILAYEKEL